MYCCVHVFTCEPENGSKHRMSVKREGRIEISIVIQREDAET